MEQGLIKKLLDEHEIQENSEEIAIKYKYLLSACNDDKDDVKKYLKHLENQKIVKLLQVIIKSRKPKPKSNKIFVKTTPGDGWLLKEDYYKVRRYNELNLKADDNFIIQITDIKKLKEILDHTDNKTKLDLYISKDDGICKVDMNQKKICYPISHKRFDVVMALKDGKKYGNFLAEKYANNNTKQLSNEINKINKIFQKKLLVGNGLIIRIKTGGYALNKEFFNINFVN
ncbi:MAG: hypothetical protein WCV69_02170 [Patescibacteria group bacterium]|jgi:hypothetical protein